VDIQIEVGLSVIFKFYAELSNLLLMILKFKLYPTSSVNLQATPNVLVVNP